MAQYIFGEQMLDYQFLGGSSLVLYLYLLYTLGSQNMFLIHNGWMNEQMFIEGTFVDFLTRNSGDFLK